MSKPVEFWCSKCDAVTVNLKDSSTGRFIQTTGHILKYDNKTGNRVIEGDWPQVLMAFCTECLSDEDIKTFERLNLLVPVDGSNIVNGD